MLELRDSFKRYRLLIAVRCYDWDNVYRTLPFNFHVILLLIQETTICISYRKNKSVPLRPTTIALLKEIRRTDRHFWPPSTRTYKTLTPLLKKATKSYSSPAKQKTPPTKGSLYNSLQTTIEPNEHAIQSKTPWLLNWQTDPPTTSMALSYVKRSTDHATSTFSVVPSAVVTTKKTIEFNDIKHATLYQLHV